jgi:hypothetical protein
VNLLDRYVQPRAAIDHLQTNARWRGYGSPILVSEPAHASPDRLLLRMKPKEEFYSALSSANRGDRHRG